MKITLRRMGSLPLMRKLRSFCKSTRHLLCRNLTLWNRAGFTGAFVDREVETRGVSVPSFFVRFLQARFVITAWLHWLREGEARWWANHIRSSYNIYAHILYQPLIKFMGLMMITVTTTTTMGVMMITITTTTTTIIIENSRCTNHP